LKYICRRNSSGQGEIPDRRLKPATLARGETDSVKTGSRQYSLDGRRIWCISYIRPEQVLFIACARFGE